MIRPLIPPLTTMAAALLLAGCGHSPAATFLVLDPAPPSSPAAAGYAGPPLRVPFVHLPVTVDRPELVRQDAAGTVKVDDFARWAAPLGLQARDTLIRDLTVRLPAGAVLPPDAPPAPREVRVEVTVLSFDVAGGQAVLTASYRLAGPGAGAGAGGARPALAQLSTPLADDGAASRAQAWSRLIGQLSDRMVAALPLR